MSQNKSLILLVIFLPILLAACGGGSSSGPGSDVQLEDSGRKNDVVADIRGEDVPGLDLEQELTPDKDVPVGDSVGEGCLEKPYGFGCPCDGNTDCSQGYCVEGPDGGVCTRICVEDCPEGWNCMGVTGAGADPVFVCVPNPSKLCFPCSIDSQCGESGVCAAFDGGNFCAISCDDQVPCPQGFSCLTGETGGGSLCIPTSGSCGCLPDNAGQIQPCVKENSFGSCRGFETCHPDEGWVGCDALEPSEEICNGMDDDCDGAYDEDLETSRLCLKGDCRGVETCQGVMGWVCNAKTPTEELCDYQDNDCDGEVDEGFVDEEGRYFGFENCGSCNTTCALGFPHATAKCDVDRDPPRCVVDSCEPDYYMLNEYQCVPNLASLCEPCADDGGCLFSSARCVPLDEGSFCLSLCGDAGTCPDGYSCETVNEESVCMPSTGSCTCDGSNPNLSKGCSITWPPEPEEGDSVITCYALQFCTGEGWGECQLPEEECDGIDNNCNGQADEGFLVDGRYIGDENCGVCGNNCLVLDYPHGTSFCDSSEALPRCAMDCDNKFHDLNGNPLDGCECEYLSNTDQPDGLDQNCDGMDGELDNGIFVAKNGLDTNSGAVASPMLTIEAAMIKALDPAAPRRDVYVATGVYNESLILAEGARIYGGYSSDFKQRNVVLYETVVMGRIPTQEKPATISAVGLNGQNLTILDGFTVFGHDNKAPGGTSYAVHISDCNQNLIISNNHIIAGDGGKGQVGPDGNDGGDGLPGAVGLASTTSSTCPGGAMRQGGSGGSATCAGANNNGGDGGDTYCPDFEQGPKSGEVGVNGGGTGGGAGGAAGWDAQFAQDSYNWFFDVCNPCTVNSDENTEGIDGANGQDGASGQAGAGCQSSTGQIVDGFWSQSQASAGKVGLPGGGGGGGGAGGGAESLPWQCKHHLGGTGGGGGSGGCGGSLGLGGFSGGASFGLFVVFDAAPGNEGHLPVISGNLIEGGFGGDGGDGGAGGTGGVGKAGAIGGGSGIGDSWCASGGGSGGKGGNGGHGGGGGGGCGGVSYCFYVHGAGSLDLTTYKSENSFVSGSGGQGGSGGPSIGNPGGSGQAGLADNFNF